MLHAGSNPRRHMSRTRKISLGLVVTLVALLAAAPWLIPTGAYKAPIEAAASKALGAPVTIGNLGVVLLPVPHATVRAVEAGSGALKVGVVRAYPRLSSLWSAPRHVSSIAIESVEVAPAGLELLTALAGAKTEGPPAVTMGEITLKDVRVTLAAGALPAVDAEVAMGEGNVPRSARVKTRDGKLTLAARPEGKAWKLELKAADWELPTGPKLRFTSLEASGTADAERLLLPAVKAQLYGGRVEGDVELGWAEAWRLAAKTRVEGLDLAPLLSALGVKAALTGRLSASGPLQAQAAKPAGLADALRGDFAFEVKEGVLHGFDLATAAKSLIKSGTSGGQTRFDTLHGNVQVAGQSYKVRNLLVTSGALDAKASVDIAASRALGGRVDVELKGTGGLVGVPLAVSGTLADPVLMPTRGALAGAAVGSVLLPGVGTAVGSSLGDKLGKLFGK
jgi:uncharacterized protein involved in outer membrane biogenesis